MNVISKSMLLKIVFLFCSFNSVGQILQPNAIQRIDSIVTNYMTTNKMVGLSIGIVKDGKICLTKGYGTTEIDKINPVDSLTNFLTCSITKLFTATAIMQLSEQGKIDISKELIHYLPDFQMKDNRYKDITIRHLLTHTSGFDWDIKLKDSTNDSNSLQKLVNSLDTKSLNFAPGTKFNALETYSNAAYDILGYLVQKISGMQYQTYILDNIFEKVGMKYSSLDYKEIPVDRRSFPHILKVKSVKTGSMFSENSEHAPSGNLNSCSFDLCNWMIHNLNIYTNLNSFDGVLNNSTLQNMWTTQYISPQNKNVSIGLGWWITNSDNLGKYYWHVGDNPGFSSTLMVFPKYNLGITVLTNGMYAEQIIWNKIPFDIINILDVERKK
jgi:CubicO group peptidase (beta-lactamase class C family)